jgi:MerR family copper efflux transcriptional regulator
MGYPMNIGQAAEAAGVTAKMIRHYESLGLIPQASRTDAGYRQYTVREVATLRFIRQSRSMGFSMKHIEQLLGLWGDTRRESRDVKALAREHIAELDRKMSEMAQMKAMLEPLAEGCHGDHRPDCPILRRLSGDAQPAPTLAAKAERKTRKTSSRPSRPETIRHDHVGLAAWMQGVARGVSVEYA